MYIIINNQLNYLCGGSGGFAILTPYSFERLLYMLIDSSVKCQHRLSYSPLNDEIISYFCFNKNRKQAETFVFASDLSCVLHIIFHI